MIEKDKFYRTRDGRPVLIHEYDGTSSFPIKGSIYKKHKGRHINPEYMTWKKTGQCLAIGVSCYDLEEISQVQANDLFEKKPLGGGL